MGIIRHPAPNKIQLRISDIQQKITRHEAKQEKSINNEEKESIEINLKHRY